MTGLDGRTSLACAAVTLVLIGGGCSPQAQEIDSQPRSPSSGAPTPEDKSITEVAHPNVCDWYELPGCATVTAVLADPLPLDDALASIDPWIPVAVYRSEPACVQIRAWGSFSSDPVEYEASDFAYVEAEQIRIRRTSTPGAPPISGAHINKVYWDHFESEWEAAQQPDSLFWGVVAYLPSAETDRLASRPGVVDVVEVPSYRTGPNPNAEYVGELYLRDHAVPRELFNLEPIQDWGCEALGDCAIAAGQAISAVDRLLAEESPSINRSATWRVLRENLSSQCWQNDKFGKWMSTLVVYLEEQVKTRAGSEPREAASSLLDEACNAVRRSDLTKDAKKICRLTVP